MMSNDIVSWLPYIFLGVLGFTASFMLHSFTRSIDSLNNTVNKLNDTVNKLGERVSHIEGKIN